MLQKLSNVSITSRIGIKKACLFSIYSKKKYPHLNFFGPVKTSVKKARKGRSFLISKRFKGYVTQTKWSRSKLDKTGLIFFKNKMVVKHRKLQRGRLNWGPILKNTPHKKIIFKFAFWI